MNFEELMDSYRNDDNYVIKKSNQDSNICYVFFSSHGLYKENNNIYVLKKVHDTNRYEWLSIFENHKISKNCKKAIFVRDIKKIFYIEGINKRIDSLEKLTLFLKTETEGMDVYLVGSSAGGYAAYIVSGFLNNVKRIYSFGGVVDLNEHTTYLEYLKTHKNRNVVEVVNSINQNAFIIHFCGSQNIESINGINIIQRLISDDRIAIVPLKSIEHAPRPTGRDIIKLLACSDKHLLKIKRKTNGKKEISNFSFSIINIGFLRATLYKIF